MSLINLHGSRPQAGWRHLQSTRNGLRALDNVAGDKDLRDGFLYIHNDQVEMSGQLGNDGTLSQQIKLPNGDFHFKSLSSAYISCYQDHEISATGVEVRRDAAGEISGHRLEVTKVREDFRTLSSQNHKNFELNIVPLTLPEAILFISQAEEQLAQSRERALAPPIEEDPSPAQESYLAENLPQSSQSKGRNLWYHVTDYLISF